MEKDEKSLINGFITNKMKSFNFITDRYELCLRE